MMEKTRMEQDVKTVGDLLGILQRRKGSLAVPAGSVFRLAIVLAAALPRSNKAGTAILIEEQENPREYVTANITIYADQRLQSINQRIMSATNLLEVINRFRLYPEMREKDPVEEIIEKMRKDIKFNTISADVIDPRTGRPAQATIAFSITYEGRDPETVLKGADELASLYLGENLKTREKQRRCSGRCSSTAPSRSSSRRSPPGCMPTAYKEKHL